MIRHTDTARPPFQEERPGLTLAGVPVTPIGMVIAAAALRGLAVAFAGLAALAGMAVLLWAFTPAAGSDATAALRAGVAAFAAANLMPVSIAGIAVTLSPMLFTGLLVVLLATTAQRGRFQPEGRYQETLAIGTTTVVYGLVVAATVRGFGPPEAISPKYVWTAPVLALGAVTIGTLLRPSGWRVWWLLVTPPWVRRGVRAGGVATATLVAGAAFVLCLALLLDFGSAVGVSALAASTWADGLGLAVVGAAYVPNAVAAAVGYVTGVGFEVGPATFSPLGSTSAELPAIPLLAAVPAVSGPTVLSLSVLAIPVLAGALAGRVLTRGEMSVGRRASAACVAAAFAGVAIGLLAYIASGGVGNGRWSNFGPPPLLLAGIVSAEVLVIGLAAVLLTAVRRPQSARASGIEPAGPPQVVETDAPDEPLEHPEAADAAVAEDSAAGTVEKRSAAAEGSAAAETSVSSVDDETPVDVPTREEPVDSADPAASVDAEADTEPGADEQPVAEQFIDERAAVQKPVVE